MNFTYDNQNRIVHITSDYIPSENPYQDSTLVPTLREFVYNYDSNGNLITDEIKSSDYTDKPSI